MRYLIIIFLSATLIFGCDYLDMVPEKDIETVETIFEQRADADIWLQGLYAVMPSMCTSLESNVAYLGADELAACEYRRNNKWYSGVFKVSDGLEMSQEPYDNVWGPMYILIRECNTFIENIDNVYNMTDGEKKQWKGEVLALKAYAYFELVRRYGPIVLVPKNLPADANISQLQLPRMHVDTCFKEIVNLLDEAIEYLPTSLAAGYTRKPYIHLEAAYAIKAKALLYAASPLFNGNEFYMDFKGKNGEPLVSTSYDPEKWRLAAEAADKAVEVCEQGGFALCKGTTGKATALLNTMMDIEQTSYSMFSNPEYILEWKIDAWWFPYYTLPRLKSDDVNYSDQVDGSLSPTMKMVEMYYTEHGLPIESDVTWNYASRYQLGKETSVLYKDVVMLNTDVLQLHLRREPRFYACIAADRTYWQRGTNTLWNNYNLPVYAYKGESFGTTMDIVTSNAPQNPGGYWLKKHTQSSINNVNYIGSMGNDNTASVIRLAELYLIQAEAWNEYLGKPNDNVYLPLNKVRERAGIDDVVTAWKSYSNQPGKVDTKEGMREIIRQEINIELAFEGQRYWNLRRWKIAELELNAKQYGWNILGESARTFYNNFEGPIVIWSKSKFTAPRNYLTPIKAEEILISSMVQNPGW